MSGKTPRERELELIHRAVARLRASVLAVVFAAVGGTGLFLATLWLLVQGGPMVGQHLNLLGNYFPGYRVTWPGAFVGFVYGALVGGFLGWTMAWVYNRVVDLRHTA